MQNETRKNSSHWIDTDDSLAFNALTGRFSCSNWYYTRAFNDCVDYQTRWNSLWWHDFDSGKVWLAWDTSEVLINDTRLGTREICYHFVREIFISTFLHRNFCISIQRSLEYISKGSIDNKVSLGQMIAWRRPGSPFTNMV